VPRLLLSLLGPYRATLDQEPIIGFESNKVRALLAYLAMEADRPHRRQSLVGLLWPAQTEAAARTNLRHALANLRQAIGDHQATPPFLLITRATIQLNPDGNYWLDVADFTQHLTGRDWPAGHGGPLKLEQGVSVDAINHLEQAVALYRSGFLEGFSLKDSPAFDDWTLLVRERLQRQALAALCQLATWHEERGEYERACDCAWRQVELEPWQEEAQRQLMHLLMLSGQRSAALTQYEICCRHLREELGVEPGPETTALYERIRAGEQRTRADRPMAVVRPSAYPLPKASVAPFVARERELARLDGFLNQALAGRGQVVFVTGGPGRGKTALLHAFARHAQAVHADLIVAIGNGNAHTGIGDPYLPFRDILAVLTGDIESKWRAGAIGWERVERLWNLIPHSAQALLDSGPDLVDTFISGAGLVARATAYAPDRPSWLGRLERLVERHAANPSLTNAQQTNLFDQYTRVLHALARQGPLLLLVDDLQWADAGSVSLLFHLGRRLAGGRVLLVGAYRPEEVVLGRNGERHPLEPLVHEFQRDFGQIVIDLAQADDRQFVDALLDTEPICLDDGFRETLYRQTGGHALFTVELLHGMQERGDLIRDEAGCWVEGAALDWEKLPARVEAVIAERIGRLPGELRALLAAASVEGEEFTAEAVARALDVDEEEIIRHLSGALSKQHRLVVARSLQRRDGQSLSGYRFRHYLFQKYLYQSLDGVERARLHEAIGNALEALYGEELPEIAVRLERHFEASGLIAKAVGYLLQAGNRAAQLFANEEAIAYYRHGLELLKTLPEKPEHAEQELQLHIALAVPLKAAKGFGDPELEQTYVRARELCQHVGGTLELFHALCGLCGVMQSELHVVRELEKLIMDLAQRQNDPYLLVQAHTRQSLTSLLLGELTACREHVDQVLALYDLQRHHELSRQSGSCDPKASSLSRVSRVFWYLGYPDQAARTNRETLEFAEKLAHPYTLAVTALDAALFRQHRQEVEAAREWADAALALCSKHHVADWLVLDGWAIQGWASVRQGQLDEGIIQLNQGLAGLRGSRRLEISQLIILRLLADAYRVAGRTPEGLAIADEALALVNKTGCIIDAPELYRLKGELLLQQNRNVAEAEACFHKAIDSAQHQQAKSWELRAAVSLTRLWRQGSSVEAAHHLLAEVYGWFTEGFDTPDLQEAKALLEELS
jgi:DNA-binding SARP family transcriptional activator